MFKKSIYNILIKESDNEYIIYNVYSAALGILDSDLKQLYDNIETLSNCNDKRVNALEENGFIVESSINEFSRVCAEERLNRYDKSTLNLTIAPTMACNMRCTYCYEDKYSKIMTENVMNKLIEFIKTIAERDQIKKLTVTWYGGEPLLQPQIIKTLSKKIIELCNEYKIKYSASIVTNGVLLNFDTAEMLKNECDISNVQITIDGLSETHNRRRILKNNKNSFDIIINNIDKVKDLLKIIIRINVDKNNIDEIDKLVDYFIDTKHWGNKVEMYFYPIVCKNTDACNVNIEDCLSCKEFGVFDSNLIRKLYVKGAKDSIRVLSPKRSYTFCTAICTNSFVVDPEGVLYKCWDFIGIKDKSIGNIFNSININSEHSKWLLLDIPQQCCNCKLVPFCKGGCPSARLYNDNKPACDSKLMSLNEKLKITYDDYKLNNGTI